MGRIYFTFKKSFLREQGITKEDIEKGLAILAERFEKAFKEHDFAYFKKRAIACLRKQYKELEETEKEEKKISKAFSLAEIEIEKAFPVGTIRTWKGKKFIKSPDKKWRPYYESHDMRGEKLALAVLAKKINALKDGDYEGLYKLLKLHRSRFTSDKSLIKDLYDAMKERGALGSGRFTKKERDTEKKEEPKEEETETKEKKKESKEEKKINSKIDKFLESPAIERMINIFKEAKVEYNPMNVRDEPLPEEEIIERLADFDGTEGSCTSLALCYIAQKLGYDVLDFRGGWSQKVVATCMRYVLPKLFTWVYDPYQPKSPHESALDCLEYIRKMPNESEYLFFAGRHCAIVRKNDKEKIQYLELQIGNGFRGWQNFDKTSEKDEKGFSKTFEKELNRRFHTKDKDIGMARLVDLEKGIGGMDYTQLNDFYKIMGYINTKDGKQNILTIGEWFARQFKVYKERRKGKTS